VGFAPRDEAKFRLHHALLLVTPTPNATLLDYHARGLEETRATGRLRSYAIGAVIEDRRSRALQLLTQTHPVLAIEKYCKELWDGSGIMPMQAHHRTAVLDTYAKWNAEDYQVYAFAYNPVPFSFNSVLNAGAADGAPNPNPNPSTSPQPTPSPHPESNPNPNPGAGSGVVVRRLFPEMGLLPQSLSTGSLDTLLSTADASTPKRGSAINPKPNPSAQKPNPNPNPSLGLGSSFGGRGSTPQAEAQPNPSHSLSPARDASFATSSGWSQADASRDPKVSFFVDRRLNLRTLENGRVVVVGPTEAAPSPSLRLLNSNASPKALSPLNLGGGATESKATAAASGPAPVGALRPGHAVRTLMDGQIFLGMVGVSVPPQEGIARLIEDLSAAGVRFVYFSPRNMRRSKPFAEKCGLETDWNCAISLRALADNMAHDPHRMTSSYADWDVKARLPHGVEAIRRHLETVDDVPLLVSLFTDATPRSTREMLAIFRANDSTTLACGTFSRTELAAPRRRSASRTCASASRPRRSRRCRTSRPSSTRRRGGARSTSCCCCCSRGGGCSSTWSRRSTSA